VAILSDRRTWRRFSHRPIALPELGTLLELTFGLQKWVRVPGVGRVPLKTSPSGGARHPVEAYLVSRNVEGLDGGLYHYAMDRHELELLQRDERPRSVVRYLPTQTSFSRAAALVIMTAVFPRVQWKYQFPRAYRVVLADAGHVCQTFCLTATWLGLAPFCSMALADSRIERDLGIDGVTESVIYVAGVGSRPVVRSDRKQVFPGGF
jgi:SagB-type dehydrogenase family enzyme